MRNHHALKLLVVGLSAACGLIVEIVAGRMIAPYLGMSLYTWTAIISVVLAGFSLGHWVGGLLAERPAQTALRGVAWSLALAALSTVATLVIIRYLAPAVINLGMGAVATVLIVSMSLFFLPSFFVGIPSPVLTKLALERDEPDRTGRTIGAFYAVGAVGSIAGTLAAGFIFISWLGTTMTLLIVAVLYLGLAILLFVGKDAGGVARFRRPAAVIVIGTLLVGYFGSQVRAFTEPCQIGSSYYCIRVIDVSRNYGTPAKVMVLDHLGHGINLQHAPQLLVSPYVELHDQLARLHLGGREPFEAFFIGGGAYTLPRAWLHTRPGARVTVAEIDPAVTRAATRQMWLSRSERLRAVHEDARYALRHGKAGPFDVIVGDAFHDIVIPYHLVTAEFFRLVAARIKGDGLYLMNVVDHQLSPRLALSIRKTMATAFKHVEIWRTRETGARTTFVLIGAARPTRSGQVRTPQSGATFGRVERETIARLDRALRPILLTDDYAPVDRLIGVE